MATRRWTAWTAIFAVLTALTLVAGLFWPSPPEKSGASETTTTTSPEPGEGTATTTVCANTWAIVQLDNGGHRVVSGGIAEIRDAQTPEQAKQAAVVYLETVKTDPEALAGTAKYFLHRDVDSSTLEKDGCATPEADQLVIEISLAIGESLVVPDEAPADGTNSGIGNDGTMVSAATSGISGDRKAIKVVLKDGTVFWIMARCGNPVVQGPGPHPTGPTDENPQPEGTTTTTVPQQCPPPKGVPPEKWDYVNCRKKDQTFDQMQNESQAKQDPQNNSTSGVNTGPTPGAPAQPHVPAPGPTPSTGTPAPNPTPGGYDSGSPTGSGTPGGSTTDSTGTQGGGSKPATQNPVDTGQGGNNTGSIPTPSW